MGEYFNIYDVYPLKIMAGGGGAMPYEVDVACGTYRRAGPIHFGGAHTFLVSSVRIPAPARKTSLSGGREGRNSCTFFSPRPRSVLYFNTGLRVHEILQVIPAEIIDEQKKKKKKKKKKNEFCPNLSEFLLRPRRSLLRHSAPCPPPRTPLCGSVCILRPFFFIEIPLGSMPTNPLSTPHGKTAVMTKDGTGCGPYYLGGGGGGLQSYSQLSITYYEM